MYTGELIESLIDNVEDAERNALVTVTVASKARRQQYDTYIYEFGRQELIGVA